MKNSTIGLQSDKILSGTSLIIWRIVQTLVWLVGAGIVIALLFFPKIGIHAFWNVLIPVAPALLVLATGLWRNICPLGTTSLLPRHAGLSKKKKLKIVWQGRLNLIGVILLLLVVPLRHVIMDTNGPVTAFAILALVVLALVMGFFFDWKSGWCSGLCPVNPVEKLYGPKVAFSLPNAHCESCVQCVVPCPDSTPGMHPLEQKKTIYHRFAGILMIGGFPGYIWGWFQVPDYFGAEGWLHLPLAFGWPFLGFAVTLVLFLILKRILPEKSHKTLIYVFASAAVSCYYWFRLPALFGFGPFPGDGMLIDLRDTLPIWFPMVSQAITTLFFVWWMVIRKQTKQWAVRPPFWAKIKKQFSVASA